jgi:hypothetical protein
MSTTVTNSPGTTANVTYAGSSASWANTDNVKTSNDVYSTASLTTGYSDYLYVSNFGFALPAGSVITSIKFKIEAKASHDRLGGYVNALPATTLDGTSFTNETSITISTTEGVVTTDNYERSSPYYVFTVSDVNSSDFGFGLCVLDGDGTPTIYSVDLIQCEIIYITPTDQTVTETVASVTETIAATTSTFDVSMANNAIAYVFNRKTGYWTYQDTAPFTSALYRPSTQKILATRRDLGQVVSFEGTDFAGVDIDSVIQTGYMNLGEFDEIKAMEDKSSEAIKRLRAFFADCKGEGNLTLTIYTENDSTGETFTLTLGTTDNATLNAVRTALSRSLHGKYIAFKLTNASGNDFFVGEMRMKILPKALR